MSISKERAALERRLATAKTRFNVAMRGRMIPGRKAVEARREIEEIEDELSILDRQEAEQVRVSKEPFEEVVGIITVPLLADVMVDIVAGVDAMLRRNNASETVFSQYTSRIRRDALALVDKLALSDSGLAGLIEVDDMLVDAVKKKLMSFVRQRMKVTR